MKLRISDGWFRYANVVAIRKSGVGSDRGLLDYPEMDWDWGMDLDGVHWDLLFSYSSKILHLTIRIMKVDKFLLLLFQCMY